MTRTRLATALVAFIATTALHAQSLADAAKRTEEERAQVKGKQEQAKSEDTKGTDKPSAPKVYTNKDLASAPVTDSAAVTETAVKESKDKGEDWWRSQSLALKRAATASAASLKTATDKLAIAQANYDGARYVYGQMLFRPELVAARDAVAAIEPIAKADAAALATFEELARRAGIMPGWLREK